MMKTGGKCVKKPHRTYSQPLRYLNLLHRAQKRKIPFVLQGQLDGLDLLRGTVGQIGNGTVLDLSTLTVGLSQKVANIGLSLSFDICCIHIHCSCLCNTEQMQCQIS